jgi:hypothetical protein
MSVGKDRDSWQELECYLFGEMLICVKEKRNQRQQYDEQTGRPKPMRCTLKGSILIKRHLKSIDASSGRTPFLPSLGRIPLTLLQTSQS